MLAPAVGADGTGIVGIVAQLADVFDHHVEAMRIALAEMAAAGVVGPAAAEANGAVADIVAYLINILVTIIIVQFVLSLLISFNVVNLHNQFVAAVWQAVNALLDPILRPVRKLMARILPDTGALDFSPLVLIVALTVLQKIVTYMAYASTI